MKFAIKIYQNLVHNWSIVSEILKSFIQPDFKLNMNVDVFWWNTFVCILTSKVFSHYEVDDEFFVLDSDDDDLYYDIN